MAHKKIPYGTKLPVKLTPLEGDLIRNKTFLDDFVKFALVSGKSIKIDMSLDDIEVLQGYIAAEANHTDNKKQQKDLD